MNSHTILPAIRLRERQSVRCLFIHETQLLARTCFEVFNFVVTELASPSTRTVTDISSLFSHSSINILIFLFVLLLQAPEPCLSRTDVRDAETKSRSPLTTQSVTLHHHWRHIILLLSAILVMLFSSCHVWKGVFPNFMLMWQRTVKGWVCAWQGCSTLLLTQTRKNLPSTCNTL